MDQSERSHRDRFDRIRDGVLKGEKKKSVNPKLTLIDAISAEEVQARRDKFKNQAQQQTYGLVSRGEEKTLQLDPQLRREYFETIQREFIKYCALAQGNKQSLRDELEHREEKNQSEDGVKDIDWVLMSLRKLREALLSLEPDEFSKKVFLFSARISTKIGKYQTYLPSVNFLLTRCPTLLTSLEFEEMATYLILHTSHFNNDNMKLMRVLHEKLPKARMLKDILTYWCNQDYWTWNSLREKLQYNLGYYKLMSFGEHRILARYLKDIGRAYFQFPRKLLENLTHQDWHTLQRDYGIQWVLNEANDRITIRERLIK